MASGKISRDMMDDAGLRLRDVIRATVVAINEVGAV
jgi:hypothetical protein